MKERFEQLWVEKYRPSKLEEVVLPEHLRTVFQSCIDKKEIPHFLFWGKAGTGKTTVARILVRALNAHCLELNASDERGIDTIRDKVKKFVMVSPFGDTWKVVFLDEADAITPPAQWVLRNMMEKYANSVRFILTANYVERIIEPIRSRCQVLEFKVLDTRQALKKLVSILEAEGVQYAIEDVMKIWDDADGDLRRAINMLQALVKGKKLCYESLKDKVDVEVLWQKTKEKDWKTVREMIELGVDTTYVLEKLFDYVFDKLSPEIAVEVIGEYLYRDSVVVNKKLNLLCCLIELSKYIY